MNQISKTASQPGTLFVVATPIGNLGDISHRALEILSRVKLVLAEDTRHSKRLLYHYGISTKLRSCHEHNETSLVAWVKAQLQDGHDLALICDAGTPLISDPGFVLIRELRAQHCNIAAVPGASSIIAALSVAGMPTDSFVFDGFLPARASARRTRLMRYRTEPRTIVILESSHRIIACIQDIVDVLGGERKIVIARELTKKFETVSDGQALEILGLLQQDADQTRGEFVLLMEGAREVSSDQLEVSAVLRVLMAELPLKQASGLAAKLTGKRKNDIYQLALAIKSGR
ncbi:MAG: 16S rRNA (cytidine(1402)-2'-O)-methyltransferase [Gammaproteobacteria bacterium]|nr:16S rRNA (cytidine(1402)-2'-O)-methyltransferase [Gammaproteobacteria bacterium]